MELPAEWFGSGAPSKTRLSKRAQLSRAACPASRTALVFLARASDLQGGGSRPAPGVSAAALGSVIRGQTLIWKVAFVPPMRKDNPPTLFPKRRFPATEVVQRD